MNQPHSYHNILLAGLDENQSVFNSILEILKADNEVNIDTSASEGDLEEMLRAREHIYDVILIWLSAPLSHSSKLLTSAIEYTRKLSTSTKLIALLEDSQEEELPELMKTALKIGVFACLTNRSTPAEIASYIKLASIKADRDKSIAELADKLNSKNIESVNDIASLTLDYLNHLVGWNKATVVLIWKERPLADNKPTRRFRSMLEYRGYSFKEINRDLLSPIEEDPLMLKIIDRFKPVIHPDLINHPDPLWQTWPETQDIASWMCLPLIHNGAAIGAITLDHRTINHYSTTDGQMLEQISNLVATAIDSRLRKRNFHTIRRIMRDISTKHRDDELLQTILVIVRQVLYSSRCTYFQRRERVKDGSNETYAEFFVDERDVQKDGERFELKEGEGIAGWVLKYGQSRNIQDSSAEPDFKPRKEEWNNPISMLAVPVKIRNRTIGVICVDSRWKNFFSDYDLELLEIVAEQVAIVIERTRMLNLLSDTSAEISKPVGEKEDILRKILQHAMRITNATSGVIHEVSINENNSLTVIKSYGAPEKFRHPKPRMDQESLTRKIILNKTVEQFAPDFGNINQIRPEVRAQGIQAVIGAPLLIGDEPIGIIYLNSPSKQSFNEIEEFSLKLFADQAATAIANAESIKSLSEQTKTWENLYIALRSVARNDQVKHTLQSIAQQACNLVGANYSHVASIVHHDRRRFIEFVATFPEEELDGLRKMVGPIDLETGSVILGGKLGISGLAVKKRLPILISNLAEEINPEYNPELAQHYIRYQNDTLCELAVPILDGSDEVIGVINIEHTQAGALNEKHKKILELFAAQAALAMQKDTILALTRQREKQLQQLAEITQAIVTASPENFQDTLYEVVNHIRKALDAMDVIVIRMIPVDSNDLVNIKVGPVFSYKPYNPAVVVRSGSESLSRQAFQTRHYIEIKDVQNDENANPHMRDAGVRAAICLPLNLPRRDCLGVMWLHFDNPHTNNYKEHELELFDLYADQLALTYNLMEQTYSAKEELRKLRSDITTSLDEYYKDSRDLSRRYNLISLVVSGLGISLILLALFKQLPDTWKYIGVIIGILSQGFNFFVFRRAASANQRMDANRRELLEIRQLSILLESSQQLGDVQARTIQQQEIISRAAQLWFGLHNGSTEQPPDNDNSS